MKMLRKILGPFAAMEWMEMIFGNDFFPSRVLTILCTLSIGFIDLKGLDYHGYSSHFIFRVPQSAGQWGGRQK